MKRKKNEPEVIGAILKDMLPEKSPGNDENVITNPKKSKQDKDSVLKVLKLAKGGLITQGQAAKLTGYCQQRISQLIKDYDSNINLTLFSDNKDKAFEALQYKILDNLSNEDIKRASLSQKILASAVLQDKIQVLRGKASDIVDYRALNLSGTVNDMKELLAEKRNVIPVNDNDSSNIQVINNDNE